MSKVTYSAAVTQALACFKSGVTPMFEGHSGIGKSALAKEIESHVKSQYEATGGKEGASAVATVIIFGSLLKEGELGGIPESAEAKHLGKDLMGETIRVNRYTIYEKIHDVLRLSLEVGPAGMVILFVDELNRTDPATQGELMQLVLDRRVQNIVLPSNVYIMAAINPDSEDSDGLDYGVTTMNEALVPRFAYYTLHSDTNTWIKWASRPSSNVHGDIVEFIADHGNLLHMPKAKGRMKAMPRSWEHFSRLYSYFEEVGGSDRLNNIYTACQAKLGDEVAKAFTSWLQNRDNPLIKPEVLLGLGKKGNEAADQVILNKLSRENVPRTMVTLSNLIKYMETKRSEKKYDKAWGTAFYMSIKAVTNIDIVFGQIKDLKTAYPELLKNLCSNTDFVNFFAQSVNSASRV